MASMRAKVAWERKVLALSVTREAARLIRESWERFSSCNRGETGNKVRRCLLSMTAIRWLTHSLTCLKGTAHSAPPTVKDATLVYRILVHFPGLWTVGFLFFNRTQAELLTKRNENKNKYTTLRMTRAVIFTTRFYWLTYVRCDVSTNVYLIRSMVETLKKTR